MSKKRVSISIPVETYERYVASAASVGLPVSAWLIMAAAAYNKRWRSPKAADPVDPRDVAVDGPINYGAPENG
jgi:hypothetical protein